MKRHTTKSKPHKARLEDQLAKSRTARAKLARLLFGGRAHRLTQPEEIVRSWHEIRRFAGLPPKIQSQVAYTEFEGDPDPLLARKLGVNPAPGRDVTLAEEFSETLETEKQRTLSAVEKAFMSWDVAFFESLIRAMRNREREGSDTQWPDMFSLELLKAAQGHTRPNLCKVARIIHAKLTRELGDNAPELDSVERRVKRLAKRLHIKTRPPGRPRE